MAPRLPVKLAAVAVAVVVAASFFLLNKGPTELVAIQKVVPSWQSIAWTQPTPTKTEIPNNVHLVFVLEDPKADFPFEFYHALSAFSASHILRPDNLYLSTNARDDQIRRARDGQAGKWSKMIFDLPNLRVLHYDAPTHAENGTGVKLDNVAHKTDFIRMKPMLEYGGLYMDFDGFVMRDITKLRRSGFNAVAGMEQTVLGSGILISKPRSKFFRMWAEQMPTVYDKGWGTHSMDLMTQICDRLEAEEGELLILDRNAFRPGVWEEDIGAATTDLYGIRDDVQSHLDNFRPGEPLPPVNGERPKWLWPWERTWVFHAVHVEEQGPITPRLVLERRSNFARAVYPLAKAMYEAGLITAQDLS